MRHLVAPLDHVLRLLVILSLLFSTWPARPVLAGPPAAPPGQEPEPTPAPLGTVTPVSGRPALPSPTATAVPRRPPSFEPGYELFLPLILKQDETTPPLPGEGRMVAPAGAAKLVPTPGPPAKIRLATEPIRGEATEARLYQLAIEVSDANHLPVADGTTVQVTVENGQATAETLYTQDGIALTRLSLPPTGAAQVTVVADQVEKRRTVGEAETELEALLAESVPKIGQQRRAYGPEALARLAARSEVEVEGNEVVTENRTRRVAFNPVGRLLTFSQAGTAGEQSLAFRLTDLRVGSRSFLAGTGEVQLNDNWIVYQPQRQDWHMVYEVHEAWVEQYFILTEAFPVTGDLVIEGDLVTDLQPVLLSEGTGIRFSANPAAETEGQDLGYGPAVVEDARGRTTLAQMELQGQQVRLTIPAAWLERAEFPVVVDPLIGPAELVTTLQTATNDPAVASDGSSFLTVWDWNRDIYAQLVAADGTLSGELIPISQAAGVQGGPDVVYNPVAAEYLVIWRDERFGLGYSSVRARRLSTSGQLQGSELELVPPLVGLYHPAIAVADSGDYLLVWHDEESESWDVYGQLFAQSGASLGARLSVSTVDGRQKDPDVAYDSQSDRFLVVWRDNRSGVYDLYGQRLAADGSLLGGNQLLAADSAPDLEPAVAGNGSGQFLVTWYRELSAADHNVYALRLTADGQLEGTVLAIDTDSGQENNPAVSSISGTSYLVVWDDDGLIEARQVDSAGNLGTVLVLRATNDSSMPAVAHASSGNQALAAWEDDNLASENIIRGRRVADTGTVTGEVLALSPYFSRREQVAASGGHNGQAEAFLLAWHQAEAALTTDVFVQPLDQQGQPSGAALNVTSHPADQAWADLARGNNGYLVVWQDWRNAASSGSDIYAHLLDASGGLAGSLITITTVIDDQLDPAVAYNSQRDEYLVLWSDYQSGSNADLYAQIIHSDGSLAGTTPLTISLASGSQRLADLVYNPEADQYLAVWRDHRNGGQADIYGQVISADGSLSGGDLALATAADTQDKPKVAYSPAGVYLAVWEDHRDGVQYDIYGQLISGSGVLSGSNFALANPNGGSSDDQRAPAIVAGQGDQAGEFLAVWQDRRNGTAHDLSGQRVGADGSLLDEPETAADESDPAVHIPVEAGGAYTNEPAVAHSSAVALYLVAWGNQDDGGVYTQRYSSVVFPMASFIPTPLQGLAPLTVTFSNTSRWASSYLWDFGDGVTSTEISPTHTYTQVGMYLVSLAASDGLITDTATQTIKATEASDLIVAGETWSYFKGSQAPPTTWAELAFDDSGWLSGPTGIGFGDGDDATVLSDMENNYLTVFARRVFTLANPAEVQGLYLSVDYDDGFAAYLNGTVVVVVGVGSLAYDAPATSSHEAGTPVEYDLGAYLDLLQAGANVLAVQGHNKSLSSGDFSLLPTLRAERISQPAAGPQASFSGAPLSGTAPLMVTFSNASSNASSYQWAFGNGSTSTEISPTHTYTQSGVYTVSLTATGPGGSDTLTRTNYITAYEAVVADFSATPLSGTVPLTVTFSNSSSGADSYQWAFGDGATSTEIDPSHAYTQSGVYTVSLTATGPGGGDILTRTNYITAYEPVVADFSAVPLTGTVPLTVTFSNSSSGADSYQWAFGDGSTSTEVSPTHTYTQSGVYTTSLIATGSGGSDMLTRTNYISVTEAPAQPPLADFSATPLSGTIPLTVTFSNASSNASSYQWTFGDGVISTEISPTHTYTQSGVYTVSLTASGPGGSDTLTRTNYITAYEAVVADFNATPLTGTVPLTVTFSNASSNADSYQWTFGDGVTSTEISPTHTYTQSGVYTVSLTATGPGGNDTLTRPAYISVTGNEITGLDFTADPMAGTAPLTVTFTSLVTPSGSYSYLWDFGNGQGGTLAHPTQTYTSPGAYTVSLRVDKGAETAAITRVNAVIVSDPLSMTLGVVAASGGVITTADGRLVLDVPPGAITETLIVGIVQTDLTEVVTNTVDGTPELEVPSRGMPFMLFNFNAQRPGQSGFIPVQFQAPVTLTYSYNPSQTDQLVEESLTFRYYNPDLEAFETISTTVYTTTMQLTGLITHFSTYGVAGDAAGWLTPGIDAAGVHLAKGSSTYRYELPLPAGPGGFAPQLTLQYNSGIINSLIFDENTDTGWVGAGWILDPGHMTRGNISLNGISDEIKEGDDGYYYTEHDTSLRIGRIPRNTPMPDGVEKLQADYRWVVTDTNGTSYFFGSEGAAGSTLSYRKHAGDQCQWRFEVYKLYKVVDVHGNTLTIDYQNYDGSRNCGGANTLPTGQSYPTSIRYTTNPNAGDTHAEYEIEFVTVDKGYNAARESYYGDGRFKLTAIKVWYYPPAGGPRQVVRVINFGYETDPEKKTNRLTSLTIADADSGPINTLPATTFTYEWRPVGAYWREEAQDRTDGHVYTYKRNPHWGRPFLNRVSNGYGGEVDYNYLTEPWSTKTLFQVAQTRTVTDTVAGPASAHQYQFSGPNIISKSGGSAFRAYSRFYGFSQADVTDPLGQLSRHYFNNTKDHILNGYELSTWVYDTTGNNLYQANIPTWTEQSRPSGVKFVSVAEQNDYLCNGQAQGQDLGNCIRSRTAFSYDGYGNLTRQDQYKADGSSRYRSTLYEYTAPNEAKWLVGLPKRQALLDAGDTVVAETHFHYDDLAYGAAPIKGNLTLQRVVSGTQYVDTTTGYDNRGNPTVQTVFNSYGSSGSVASGDPRQTTTSYDGQGLLPTRVTNPLGHTTETSYDYRFQVPTVVTDSNEAVTVQDYDTFGRLTAVWLPDCGGNTSFDPSFVAEYGDFAAPYYERARQRIDPCSGQAGTYADSYVFYDGLGRKIQAQGEGDSAGSFIISNVAYDALGRVARSGLPYAGSGTFGAYQGPNWSSGETQTSYDPLGRTKTVTAPDSTTTNYAYLKDTTTGLPLTEVVDANGHKKGFVNDEGGNLIRAREFSGSGPYSLYAETSYAYDLRDNLLQVTDAAGNLTTISYDALGRKVSMDDPDMGFWRYGYDPLGNLTGQTDARGVVTSFSYDNLNRLTGQGFSDGTPGATYTYDQGPNGVGRRTGMSDAAGSVTWLYDSRGRLVSQGRAFSGNYAVLANTLDASGRYTTSYTYNGADWLTGLTYPDGEVVTTTYTDRGLAKTLTTSLGGSYVTATSYNPLAQVTGRTTGNGLTTGYTYHSAQQGNNRLARIQVQNGGSSLLDLSYTIYDAMGNIMSLVDNSLSVNGQSFSFGYDHLDRLTSAASSGGNIPGYDEAYSYNEIGNLTSRNGQSYTYPASGPSSVRPHAVTAVGSDSYSYDANGNMTGRTEAGVTYSQAWNAFNKLKRVTWTENGEPYTTTFVYDGDGERLLKIEQLPSPMPGGGQLEITTLYIGQIYEKQFNTTADGLSEAQAWLLEPQPGADFLAAADFGLGGTPIRATPVAVQTHRAATGKGLAAPLLVTYGYTDNFNSLDTSVWSASTTGGISLAASGGKLRATRGSTYTAGWTDWASILSNQRVNFSGATGTSLEWQATLETGAMENIINMRVRDTEANRFLAFDCSVAAGSPAGKFACVIVLRELSGSQTYIWSYSLGTDFNRGQIYTFKMVYTGLRTVDFYIDGQLQTSKTFSLSEWNNLDWVQPEWLVAAWAGTTNTIDASLTRFAFSNANDSASPTNPTSANPGCSANNNVWQKTCNDPNFTWSGASDGGTGVGSGVKGYYYYWGTSAAGNPTTWTTTAGYNPPALSGNGPYTYYLRVKTQDWAGNTSQPATLFTFKYDNDPPPAPSMTDELDYTQGSSNTVSWSSVTDPATGSAMDYQVQQATNSSFTSGVVNSTWQAGTSKSYSGLSNCQIYYYRARSRDEAGNMSGWSAPTSSIQDASAPTGSITINNGAAWTNNPNVTLNLTVNDCAPTNLLEMRFQNENGNWPWPWESYNTARSWTLVDDSGIRRVYVQFRDAASPTQNTSGETAYSDTIGLDVISPTITSFVINNGDSLTNDRAVTLSITANDTGGSGLSQMRFSNNGSTWPSWEPYTTTRAYPLPAGDGSKTVYLQVQDTAGNETAGSDTITLDTIPPDITLDTPGATWPDPDLLVSGEATGALNGSVQYHLVPSGVTEATALDQGSESFSQVLTNALQAGANTLTITATDQAGNPSVVTRSVSLDQSAPAVLNPSPAGLVGQAQPVISAQFSEAVAAAETRVWLDGQPVGAAITATGFTYTPAQPLAAEAYEVAVKPVDLAGNSSDARWTFTVDLSTTVAIDLPALVNRSPLTVPVSGEPGATVSLTVNGLGLGQQTYEAGGQTSFTNVMLQESSNNVLTAVATDTLGHTAQDSLTVEYNPNLPVLLVTAEPAAFAPQGRVATTRFDLEAQPPAGASLSAWRLTVKAAAGGAVVTETSGIALPADVVWDGRNLNQQVVGAGDYLYTLVVTASNGLAASSPEQVVSVIDSAPAAPVITSPANGTVTTLSQIKVAGTAEPGSVVGLFDTGGYLTDTVTVEANGNWQFKGRGLVGGDNVLYATATNAFGTGPASTQVTVSLHPRPPLYPPTNVLPATAQNGQSVTFSAEARQAWPEEGPPTQAVTATIYSSTPVALSKPAGCQAAQTCTWTAGQTLANFNDGDYRVDFLGVDEGGQIGDGESFLRLESPPPPPLFTYPAQPTLLPAAETQVNGTASPFSTVRLYRNGTLVDTTTLGAGDDWAFSLSLVEGSNTLTATAARGAQVSAPSQPASITVDTLPPAVTTLTPETYQQTTLISLAWSGSDAGTGVAGYHLEHRLGSSGPWERLLNHTSQTGYNYTAVEGVHHFRVQAIDAVSHPSTWATTVITVDLNNPGLSLNAITETSPNAYAAGNSLYYGPNGSGDFTISVDASDNLAGLAEIGFPATTSSGTTLQAGGVLNTTASHLYTFDSADTFDGPAQISATDRAGNTGSLTVNILRDEQGPAITLEAAPRGLFIDLSWQLSDAQTGLASCELAVQVDGGAWTPLSTDCAGSLTYSGQANTTYRFRAQGTDNVNNTASQQTASLTPDSVTKYYHHGDERVAMRQGGAVYYLYGDHLGSTSLTTGETGAVVAEARYRPFGQERWSGGAAVTDFGFTGQRVEAGFGLLDYKARYYDPGVGRFVAADAVVADYANPQALNRYSYVRNNPLKYIDPTGHADVCGITAEDCGSPVSGEIIVGIYRSKQWREEAFAPVVEYIDAIKEAYADFQADGTFSFSASVGASGFGQEIAGNLGIVHIDEKGNMAFGTVTVAYGANTTWGASVGPNSMLTNAADLSELAEYYTNSGVIFPVGAAGVNADYVGGHGKKGKITGVNPGVGFGLRLPKILQRIGDIAERSPVGFNPISTGIHSNGNYTIPRALLNLKIAKEGGYQVCVLICDLSYFDESSLD